MKSRSDPRHRRRQLIVQQLFANIFHEQDCDELTQKIWNDRDSIDAKITASAPQWPIEKINRTDLSILRLAVYEIHHTQTPPKVIIDEAVELAKEFGGESSPSFINGVLGSIVKSVDKTQNDNNSTNSNPISE